MKPLKIDRSFVDEAEEIFLINASDMKFTEKGAELKRKYGKFKRPVYKLKNGNTEKQKADK